VRKDECNKDRYSDIHEFSHLNVRLCSCTIQLRILLITIWKTVQKWDKKEDNDFQETLLTAFDLTGLEISSQYLCTICV
jgi:hypothetical protein